MTEKRVYDISSCGLHILAMALMLSDHLWATFFGNLRWMTSIGRIAFPIFAFMTVEGYFHTSNIKKYKKRLLIFALISEIPFNLLMGGRMIGPFHQNVLWTFWIGLGLIQFSEFLKKKGRTVFEKLKKPEYERGLNLVWTAAVYVAVCYVAYFVGNITFVDYFGAGLLTVVVFYIFHERKWYNYLFLLAAIYYINAELLAGMTFIIPFGSMQVEFAEQALAVLALIPIWLYQGRQGYHSRWFKNFCYWFYPAHMLILALLSRWL